MLNTFYDTLDFIVWHFSIQFHFHNQSVIKQAHVKFYKTVVSVIVRTFVGFHIMTIIEPFIRPLVRLRFHWINHLKEKK